MNAMSKYQTIHHSHRASAGRSHAVRRSVLMILVSVILSTGAFAQGVGISESAITPDASAILELRSTTRGFLMPRNSATLGFTVQGLSFYNTTSNRLNYHNGSTWLEVPAKADNLSVFASTTSAQLLGLLSDETGTGLAVFATSPTLTTPNIGVATATSVNKVAITAPATGSTLTIADGKTLTASNTLTFTGTDGSTLNIGAGGTLGSNAFSSSAFAPLASPTFTGTVTVPTPFTLGATSVTTTGAELNFVSGVTSAIQTQLNAKQGTLTNSAGLAGALSDETGTGLAVFATSPSLTTPTLGVATATSVNKVAITAPATGSTLTIADGKTLTASNTLTFAGTDGSTLNIGAGGTLGSNAFTSTSFAPLASPTFTGTVTVPTPFTLGATSVTATGAELNFVSGVTSAIQTQINAKQGTLTNSAGLAGALSDETGTGAAVFANTPTLVTPVLGAATGTSLSLGGGTALTTTNRTGTGNLVLATSPTLTTPVLGVATATSVNGLSLTANATGFSIAGGTVSKTLTASNSLTFAGTDGSTLNIGAGGTLGSNAYTSTSFAPLASPTFTGTVTVPTPFTLGATSVTATGAELNFVSGVTSAIQTQINAKQGTLTNSAGLAGALSDETGTGLAVFATSPTLTTPTLGVATATSVNKVAITAPATGSTLTIADGKTLTASNSLTFSGTDGSTLNIGAGGTLGSNAYTSTSFAPLASPTFTGTVTVPTPFTLGATSVTATGAELNFVSGVTSAIQTQINSKQGTLTNSAGLAGALSDETGSGLAVFATSPTLTTPVLGVATATSVNGLSLTANATGFSIAGGTVSKTLTASNTLTFAGTDGSTLNIGAGGTLGSNAFTSTSFAPLASPTFTGTVTIPTPFTLGATSVTATGAELNFVSGVTSAIQTQINSKQGTLTNSAGLAGALSDETGTGLAVFATSPALTTPDIGAATGTSLALGGGTALTTTNRTGTGNLVLATSPTLVTPVLGVATGTSLALGGGTALTTTNQTGTGNLVLANTPTLVTPVLGVATGTSLALGGGTALTTTNQTGTGNLVLANTPTLVTPNIGAATGTSLSVTGALTAQSVTNQLVLGTTNTTTLSATAPAASRTYTLPDFGANGVIPIGTAGNSIALTTTGATNVTLPTSGTLATIGVLVNIQVLQNPTVTYTPTAGARTAIVYLLGGGGGGGAGGSAATANRMGPGSGGGSGSLVVLEIPDLSIAGSYTIAVGTGGASATAGVATTLIYNGVTTTAPGGGAGNVGTTTNGAVVSIGGAGGAVGTNGTVNGRGENGIPGIGISATVGMSGNGASSPFGNGGLGRSTHGIGNAASGFGSGGGGGLQRTTGAIVAGGAGSNGVIIVYEFK